MAAPTVDPISHPWLELQIRRQRDGHSVLEPCGLHQWNQLVEEDPKLLGRDAFRWPARVDRRQEKSYGNARDRRAPRAISPPSPDRGKRRLRAAVSSGVIARSARPSAASSRLGLSATIRTAWRGCAEPIRWRNGEPGACRVSGQASVARRGCARLVRATEGEPGSRPRAPPPVVAARHPSALLHDLQPRCQREARRMPLPDHRTYFYAIDNGEGAGDPTDAPIGVSDMVSSSLRLTATRTRTDRPPSTSRNGRTRCRLRGETESTCRDRRA